MRVGSRVRAKRRLIAAERKSATSLQLTHGITIEIEGDAKPPCIAEALTLLYYNP